MQRAINTVRNMHLEAWNASDANRRKAIVQHANKSESLHRLLSMIDIAKNLPDIQIKLEEFDTDRFLLNVLNGTIDLRTGELHPHDRSNLITKMIRVEYCGKPGAAVPLGCPTWLCFLNRIFDGNEEVIRFVQRAVGYALTGSDREQCLFLLHSTGANGKSTFIETIRSLMGEYAQQADTSSFLLRKNNSIRNDIARMRGARFVSAVEAGSGKKLDESLVKQITGGDMVTARFLFAEYFDFQPQFKLFLASNQLPEISGTDGAIWRRIKVIPFTFTIVPGSCPRNLSASSLVKKICLWSSSL
jgi:putative DNA primase/helicase